MHSENPVTLYIVTEPVDKTRLQPLVRVLVNQHDRPD
jgi:type IV secretion system protein VirD4